MIINPGNNTQNIGRLRGPPCSRIYVYKPNTTYITMPLYPTRKRCPRNLIVTNTCRVLIVNSISAFRGFVAFHCQHYHHAINVRLRLYPITNGIKRSFLFYVAGALVTVTHVLDLLKFTLAIHM